MLIHVHRLSWTFCEVLPATQVDLAKVVRANMTVQVVAVITAEDWKGSKLVQLQDENQRPTSADLNKNLMWLKPLCQKFPDRAPRKNFVKFGCFFIYS